MRLIAVAAIVSVMASCSSTKHVPDGQYLLDDVKFNITNNENAKSLKSTELVN